MPNNKYKSDGLKMVPNTLKTDSDTRPVRKSLVGRITNRFANIIRLFFGVVNVPSTAKLLEDFSRITYSIEDKNQRCFKQINNISNLTNETSGRNPVAFTKRLDVYLKAMEKTLIAQKKLINSLERTKNTLTQSEVLSGLEADQSQTSPRSVSHKTMGHRRDFKQTLDLVDNCDNGASILILNVTSNQGVLLATALERIAGYPVDCLVLKPEHGQCGITLPFPENPGQLRMFIDWAYGKYEIVHTVGFSNDAKILLLYDVLTEKFGNRHLIHCLSSDEHAAYLHYIAGKKTSKKRSDTGEKTSHKLLLSCANHGGNTSDLDEDLIPLLSNSIAVTKLGPFAVSDLLKVLIIAEAELCMEIGEALTHEKTENFKLVVLNNFLSGGHMVDSYTDIQCLIDKADIVLDYSQTNEYGIHGLNAMLAGKIIICPGENMGDPLIKSNVEDLVNVVRSMLSEPKSLERLRLDILEYATIQHNPEAMVERMLLIYNSMD